MKALNQKTLDELKELMGESYLSVFQAFAKSAKKCIEDIELAVAKNDIQVIERSSHTLKGSSANIGAINLSKLCADVVDMARNSVSDGYLESLGKVKDEYKKVEAEIDVLLGE